MLVPYCVSSTSSRKQLGHRLDLGPIRREVAGLQEKAEILADHARVASTDDAPINEALMRASRALVPINYTTGERFRHDSALPHTAWPALDGIRELAAAEIGPSELPFLVVHARQTRNRIAYGLAQANQSLAAALQAIGGSTPNPSRRASS